MKSRHIRIIAILVSAALILTGTAALLIYHGVILLNNPSETEYPVRGVDVSSYQGEIDWGVLSAQNLDFAFIKATEGSSMVDPCFAYNFSEAQKCDISVGAYHFFSYDSPGVDVLAVHEPRQASGLRWRGTVHRRQRLLRKSGGVSAVSEIWLGRRRSVANQAAQRFVLKRRQSMRVLDAFQSGARALGAASVVFVFDLLKQGGQAG